MTIAVNVYDWPSIVPVAQLFHEGGQAFEGGYTSGGVRMLSPEPGGFGWLDMEFGEQDNQEPDALVSWACSAISNGRVFRIPLARSPQFVRPVDLGISLSESGVPWNNDQPWDNGQNWAASLTVVAAGAALEGVLTFTVDMGTYLPALRPGHVISHKDVAYKIDDIEYDGQIATVTTFKPLRKAITSGDVINLRPIGTFSASNPESFRGLYRAADLIRLGSVRFHEVIV